MYKADRSNEGGESFFWLTLFDLAREGPGKGRLRDKMRTGNETKKTIAEHTAVVEVGHADSASGGYPCSKQTSKQLLAKGITFPTAGSPHTSMMSFPCLSGRSPSPVSPWVCMIGHCRDPGDDKGFSQSSGDITGCEPWPIARRKNEFPLEIQPKSARDDGMHSSRPFLHVEIHQGCTAVRRLSRKFQNQAANNLRDHRPVFRYMGKAFLIFVVAPQNQILLSGG